MYICSVVILVGFLVCLVFYGFVNSVVIAISLYGCWWVWLLGFVGLWRLYWFVLMCTCGVILLVLFDAAVGACTDWLGC